MYGDGCRHDSAEGRHDLKGLSVHFEGDRAETQPKRYTRIHVRFDVTGPVPEDAVARAIKLSHETYCSVSNSLRQDIAFHDQLPHHALALSSLATTRVSKERRISPVHRRTYIDWLRGVAVLIMIEWHAMDAWTNEAARVGQPFWSPGLSGRVGRAAVSLSRRCGGAPGGGSQRAQGDDHPRGGMGTAKTRLADLGTGARLPFSVVLCSTRMPSGTPCSSRTFSTSSDLGLVAAAFCWGRSATLRGRMTWLLGPAALVLVLAPLSRAWAWPTLLHPRLEAYIRPNGGFGVFPLFPWVAFVFVGAASASGSS